MVIMQLKQHLLLEFLILTPSVKINCENAKIPKLLKKLIIEPKRKSLNLNLHKYKVFINEILMLIK